MQFNVRKWRKIGVIYGQVLNKVVLFAEPDFNSRGFPASSNSNAVG